MAIGERIQKLRAEKKLTQADLARALSISRQAVSKWESDQSSPDTLNLIRLANVLDTDVEYLATGVKPVYQEGPIVINVVKKVDQIVDRVVEKPVIHRVMRVQYRRYYGEYVLVGVVFLLIGIAIGSLF